MREFSLNTFLGLAATLGLAACVEAREPPALPDQAEVSYGDRLYLVDDTRDTVPTLGRCTRLGAVVTTTSTSATPEVQPLDGRGPLDPTVPHNCFVPVAPKRLKVDTVEVTNDLFQLCVDSGACKAPDPSKSNKGQVCSDEDAFDRCPMVEVSQQEAANFCTWIGRRLPSGLEHLALRQAAFGGDLTRFTPYPGTSEIPAVCDDAVLRTAGCMASRPRPITLSGGTTGAASRDAANAEGGKRLFDLVGNVAEWTSDLFPIRRGNAEGLPWFCVAALPNTIDGPFSADNPPACPSQDALRCVYAQYQPSPDLPLGIWPVCLTNASGRFSGTVGALHGGSFRDQDATPERVGVFARRTEADPQGLPDTARSREYGFRCVGDRPSAVADGPVLPFEDEIEVRRLD